jgi:phosphate transport system ATP-binding protein
VIVTHNIGQAIRIADYIAFMYRGELIEYGPTREIVERPKNRLTEEYLTGKIG